jgi:protein-tyrosine phosphatase
MKRILMVCLGNICRSPMAEGILKHHLAQHGIDAFVDSAGTSAWHAGEQPDHRAISTCKSYGIDISNQRSRPFDPADFNDFDLIFAMDQENYNTLRQIAPGEKEREKLKMIMNMVVPGRNLAVPDPYYGGDQGFHQVYEMLNLAAEAIVLKHLNKGE